MKPIKDSGTNAVFGSEGYGTLYAQIYSEPDLDGEKCIQAVWELTDDDIEQVVKSKRIYVSIVGDKPQPICLDVIPFAKSTVQ